MATQKLRSVNTSFWKDPFIEDLSPQEKLLFLFFLTNDHTNLLGVYEISMKRICYETGLDKTSVHTALEKFTKEEKVLYVENYIILPNFYKNQRLNDNMRKNASDVFDDLPNWLKKRLIGNGSKGLLNGYETIPYGSGKKEVEVEVESEVEEEKKSKKKNNSADDSKNWKKDFDTYKAELRREYKAILKDEDWLSQQERYNSSLDIKLSIEKAVVNYWATEEGWDKKRKSKAQSIDWRRTLSNALSLTSNKVYKKGGFNSQPEKEPKYKTIKL